MTPEHWHAAQVVQHILSSRVGIAKSATGDYRSELGDDLQNALDGDLLVGECRKRHKRYLSTYGEQAYIEGLRAGGVDDELSEEDQAAIDTWVSEQSEFIGAYWDDVQKAINEFDNGIITQDEYKARRLNFEARLDTWTQALAVLEAQGRASAQGNMMVTWHLGKTEKHCKTCARLDGKRRRLKWFMDNGYIPQEPGSDTLQCGGYNCDCTLKSDKGRVIVP